MKTRNIVLRLLRLCLLLSFMLQGISISKVMSQARGQRPKNKPTVASPSSVATTVTNTNGVNFSPEPDYPNVPITPERLAEIAQEIGAKCTSMAEVTKKSRPDQVNNPDTDTAKMCLAARTLKSVKTAIPSKDPVPTPTGPGNSIPFGTWWPSFFVAFETLIFAGLAFGGYRILKKQRLKEGNAHPKLQIPTTEIENIAKRLEQRLVPLLTALQTGVNDLLKKAPREEKKEDKVFYWQNKGNASDVSERDDEKQTIDTIPISPSLSFRTRQVAEYLQQNEANPVLVGKEGFSNRFPEKEDGEFLLYPVASSPFGECYLIPHKAYFGRPGETSLYKSCYDISGEIGAIWIIKPAIARKVGNAWELWDGKGTLEVRDSS